MAFRVGQKVIYLGPGPRSFRRIWKEFRHPFERPKTDGIYTVANVYFHVEGDEEMIELLELPSPEDDYWAAGFRARRFRPVVERKTDISIFEAMLTGTKKRRVLAQGE
jgi:hypothetical protein